jgi:hypothetical protein
MFLLLQLQYNIRDLEQLDTSKEVVVGCPSVGPIRNPRDRSLRIKNNTVSLNFGCYWSCDIDFSRAANLRHIS